MPILMLKKVTLAFPALHEPQAIGDGKPAFGGKLIIDPEANSREVRLIEAAIKEAATEKWGKKADEVLAMLREDNKICFSKRPYRSKKTGEVYDGFEGMYHLGTRSETVKPSCYDGNGDDITASPLDVQRVFYSGSMIHAEVEIWAQDNQWGRRINCTLMGAMFNRHGRRFGGGAGPSTNKSFAGLVEEGANNDRADGDDLV